MENILIKVSKYFNFFEHGFMQILLKVFFSLLCFDSFEFMLTSGESLVGKWCKIQLEVQQLYSAILGQSSVSFLYPLKTPENLWFFDVFRGYRKGTLDWNWLSYLYFTSFDEITKPNLHKDKRDLFPELSETWPMFLAMSSKLHQGQLETISKLGLKWLTIWKPKFLTHFFNFQHTFTIFSRNIWSISL